MKSVNDLPPFEDYAMKNRTCRYLETELLFPFGFGLSYTKFAYSDLKITKTVTVENGSDEVQVSVEVETTVTNTGNYRGDEVVQLYLSDPAASVPMPKYALRSFQRVTLWPGASTRVRFTLTQDMLKLVNEKGERDFENGDFKIFVGGSTPSQRSLDLGAVQYLEGMFTVK